MEFNKGKQFLDSINVYSHLFRGNGFTAGVLKNEIETAFSENSKYRDFDFDFLFDLAREFVNELNENSNKHSFAEIERFYNNKLELFYTDLKGIYFIDAEINKRFNEKTGTFENQFNDKLKTIIIGIRNTYKIIFDGLKQYFDIPISSNILKEFYPFEHKFLQPQQTEKPKPELNETELSERIKKHFGFFNRNCPRKHKQILSDTDFGKLIEWAIWYFENEFKVPEILEPIKVVNTNKTFVQLAFKYLFKELNKSSPYPETLFEFYQSAFAPYSEDKKSNFEAVKNNDEVKKLMQIDH